MVLEKLYRVIKAKVPFGPDIEPFEKVQNGEVIAKQEVVKHEPSQNGLEDTKVKQGNTKAQARQIIGSLGALRSVAAYLNHLKASGKRKRTVEEYHGALRKWNIYSGCKAKTIYNLTYKEIETAIIGVSPAYANLLLAALKSYAKWAHREGHSKLLLELEKIERPKTPRGIPKAKSEREFENIKDQAKALCEAGKKEGIWIGLMLCCGLRISEIQVAQMGPSWVQVIGKGGYERRIPAPGWLIRAALNINGWRRNRKWIDQKLRTKYGLTHLHSLRHTYATILLDRGLKLEEIQKLLGHAKIDTTLTYAKVSMPTGVIALIDPPKKPAYLEPRLTGQEREAEGPKGPRQTGQAGRNERAHARAE